MKRECRKAEVLDMNRNFSFAALLLTLTMISSIFLIPIQEVYPQAKTRLTITPYFMPIIGENSPTLISYYFTGVNPFLRPPYQVPANTPVKRWDNATVTFIRPDGSKVVVRGPLDVYYCAIGAGTFCTIEIIFTPDKQGTWRVNFYWPGDSLYEPINRTDSFKVGPHYEKRKTFAMLSLRPYPAVGIHQQLLINAWVTPPPPTAYSNYRGYKFTIKSPTGRTWVFTMDSETPGTVWFDWYPDELGNWTITFEYPGDWLNQPCSVTRTVKVQEQPIFYIEDTPLPSTAWSFPINIFNREWRNIAGNWFQIYYNASAGSWNPYTVAPKSAHVLWKLGPVSGLGGFIGSPYPIYVSEELAGVGAGAGVGTYAATLPNIRTVMAGRGYYTAGGYIYCVDMFTGKLLWTRPGTFSVGGIRDRMPVLYSFPTSVGGRFIIYNGLDGSVVLNVTGLPSTFFDGRYAYYCISGTFNDAEGTWVGGRVVKWDTAGTATDYRTRIVWNVSFPAASLTTSHALIYNGLLIARNFKVTTIFTQEILALNLTDGSLAYRTEIMDRSDPNTWIYRQGPAIGSGFGLVYFAGTAYDDWHSVYFAFNASTGKLKWVCKIPEEYYPWSNFFAYMPQACAYGRIYVLSYAGVFALNATNGEILWHYSAGNSGMETPYNTWPFGSVGPVIGGGVVFAPNTEHSPTLYYRGMRLHAIDAFTGERIWTILGYHTPTAIAYGILISNDAASATTYAFGKGETKTTISVSSKVTSVGSAVLIEGHVLDLSPAQNGTPAVSDEDMTPWMEYLHMQQPKPQQVRGVTVELYAIKEDGRTISIGTTTTDPLNGGLYRMLWTPSEEGVYTIVAVFHGSNSYYASSAATSIGVTVAPEKPAAPTIEIPPATDYTPLLWAIIAIMIIATLLGVIGIALTWKSRKQVR